MFLEGYKFLESRDSTAGRATGYGQCDQDFGGRVPVG
jgi:hypothetical protein